MKNSMHALKVIDYLESVGRTENAFSEAFPYIHHFHYSRTGDPSLKAFISHCRQCELTGKTNLNILKRLEIIQEKTVQFVAANPDAKISSMKFQKFGKESLIDVPV